MAILRQRLEKERYAEAQLRCRWLAAKQDVRELQARLTQLHRAAGESMSSIEERTVVMKQLDEASRKEVLERCTWKGAKSNVQDLCTRLTQLQRIQSKSEASKEESIDGSAAETKGADAADKGTTSLLVSTELMTHVQALACQQRNSMSDYAKKKSDSSAKTVVDVELAHSVRNMKGEKTKEDPSLKAIFDEVIYGEKKRRGRPPTRMSCPACDASNRGVKARKRHWEGCGGRKYQPRKSMPATETDDSESDSSTSSSHSD